MYTDTPSMPSPDNARPLDFAGGRIARDGPRLGQRGGGSENNEKAEQEAHAGSFWQTSEPAASGQVRQDEDPMRIHVRLERPGDQDQIRVVNERAFGGSEEARIVDALRGCEGSLSLVATAAGGIVGHILFTPVRIEPPRAARVAGLAPMSVLPEQQRQGVGSALIAEGLSRCRELGYTAVVVVGHPEYYPRFGFVQASTRALQYEYSVPSESFMLLELVPDALKGPPGVAHYRPEFYAG